MKLFRIGLFVALWIFKMETFPFESITKFFFKREPISLPAELRPIHKIGIILLFLKLNSRSSTSSILKLQFLNWVLKTDWMKKQFINEMNESESTYILKVVHLDPTVNRAIQYAIAENLITLQSNGKIKLAEMGLKFADKIMSDKNLYIGEKNYLTKLGKKISDVQVKNVLFGQ